MGTRSATITRIFGRLSGGGYRRAVAEVTNQDRTSWRFERVDLAGAQFQTVELRAARADVLAFTTFPRGICGARSGRTTSGGRLNGDIRGRTDVVSIFPDRNSVTRLVGAVLAENTTNGRRSRYLGLGLLTRVCLTTIPGTTPAEEVTPTRCRR